MKIGHTDFSKESLAEIREMTLNEAIEKYPMIHKDVLATIVKPEKVEKPKSSKK